MEASGHVPSVPSPKSGTASYALESRPRCAIASKLVEVKHVRFNRNTSDIIILYNIIIGHVY